MSPVDALVFVMFIDEVKYQIDWDYDQVETIYNENVIYLVADYLSDYPGDISQNDRCDKHYTLALCWFRCYALIHGNRPG